MLILKDYQERALQALKDYFSASEKLEDADTAFYETTKKWIGRGIPYRGIDQLPGLPYVCLRIPTGGGKTLVACHAAGLAQNELLGVNRSVILWLVPSNAIKEQTINALKDKQHPYRQALDSNVGSVEVMDTTQALYLQRAVLDSQTVVIVSTLQAFRVDETEGRKVYEQAGALEHHFDQIAPQHAESLECYDGLKKPIPSLANVLKQRRPVVIVDEAHNARTPLSFDTLARFNPSCIIEFTATPDTEKNPSNVLYHVSAAELKAENMIKIPIRLETRNEWKQLLADSIAMRNGLEKLAEKEQQQTGEYIRPIMLLQAQRKSQTQDTLTFDVLKETLIKDHNIPEDQIAVATGNTRELEGVDVKDNSCPIRYVITVDALREGWDCPFAYILYTVSESYSSKAVEQILGRILRLPQATEKQHDPLNLAYAYASSPNWPQVAMDLKDALVGNGFNKLEAKDLITFQEQQAEFWDDEEMPLYADMHIVSVEEVPEIENLSEEIKSVVSVDPKAKTITFKGEIDEKLRDKLTKALKTKSAKTAVTEAFERSQAKKISRQNKLRKHNKFSIPYLGIHTGNLFEQFEKSHILDHPWKLANCEAILTESDFSAKRIEGSIGEIGIDDSGNIEASPETEYFSKLASDLRLIDDGNWSESALVIWLDEKIKCIDIPKPEKTAFITKVIQNLISERDFRLQQLVVDKLRLRKAVDAKVDQHRKEAQGKAYQSLLFDDNSPIEVNPEYSFDFDPKKYPASTFYKGGYKWTKHYYDHVGELKASGEEFECATYIDQMEGVEFWIRNLERKETSFWLQTSTDRFYPDFVCKLKDGRILVVEYKGADRWSNDDSKEKRLLGEVWEKRSNGKCLFIMPKGKDLKAIKTKINN